ncbi:hypothetical protein J6590_001330 [Homalodisca vitripennis]|nr:hypothetical protein J6590_001330 [Homalodisca vitripennis]
MFDSLTIAGPVSNGSTPGDGAIEVIKGGPRSPVAVVQFAVLYTKRHGTPLSPQRWPHAHSGLRHLAG